MTHRDAMALALAEQVELELDHLTRLAEGATALDVIRSAIAVSTVRLTSSDPVVRAGEDPEGVHKARVAARRLRSDLRTFRPYLDRDWADALRDEIGWLGRLLGPVRDAEVLAARLRRRVAAMVGPRPALREDPPRRSRERSPRRSTPTPGGHALPKVPRARREARAGRTGTGVEG